MNHKIKRKWVAALRSDKYQQCYDNLFEDDETKACAMGVLYKISREDYYRSGHDDIFSLVVHMNDTQHKTFSEIADWIEENIHERM